MQYGRCRIFTLSCGLMLANLAWAAEETPEQILEKAETIRNPSEDYTTKVLLNDIDKGKEEKHVYDVSLKGRDKALVKFVEPAADAGQKVLMVGSDMWIFLPTSAKPIRISAKQKLTGNAAYGDVTRLTFIGNYTVKLLRKDTLANRKAYVLQLDAIDGKQVSYDKVEYWVDMENHRPLKALYKTIGDKVLREGQFEDYQKVFGILRPCKFILIDYLNRNHVTQMQFSDAKKAVLADLMFQKQNLGRE